VDLAGGVSLEATDGFERGLVFGDAAGEVVAGAGIEAQAEQGDAVEHGVGLSVTPAREPVAGGFTRGCLLGTDAAQRGGRWASLRSRSGVVTGGDEQGCCGVEADAAVGQQRGGVARDRVGEPLFSVVDLLAQHPDAPEAATAGCQPPRWRHPEVCWLPAARSEG